MITNTKAIEVKYIGATNCRMARISLKDDAGNRRIIRFDPVFNNVKHQATTLYSGQYYTYVSRTKKPDLMIVDWEFKL